MNRAERRRKKKSIKRSTLRASKTEVSPVPPLVSSRTDADAVLQQALQLHEKGRLAEAKAIYLQVLRTQPDHSKALHFMGVICHQTGKNEAAKDLIEKSLSSDPAYADAHNNLGNVFLALRKPEEALKCYQTALTLENGESCILHKNVGTALTELDRYDEAIQSFRDALSIGAGAIDIHVSLGCCLARAGRYNEAIEHLVRCSPPSEDWTKAMSALMTCQIMLGRAQEVAKLKSLSDHNDLSYFKNILLENDYAKALTTCKPINRLDGQVHVSRCPGGDRNSPVTLVSGDMKYITVLLPMFLTSFLTSENRGWVHVHTMLTDPGQLNRLTEIIGKFPSIPVSYSFEHVPAISQNRVYYSTIRFPVISYLYESGYLNGPLFAIDIDSEVKRDLSDLWKYFENIGAHIGLLKRRSSQFEQQLAAGALYLSGTPVSRRYIEDSGAYILHGLLDRNSAWYLDQNALFMVYLSYLMEDGRSVFTEIPTTFLDWDQNQESYIWTFKGKDKIRYAKDRSSRK